jgi:glutathione S-transferase
MFLTNTVQPAFLRFFYPARYTNDPNGADLVQANAVDELTALRSHISGKLGSGPFLQGNAFSIADIYLAMLSSWGTELQGAASWWADTKVAAHYDAVLARPGARRAVEEEGGSLGTT